MSIKSVIMSSASPDDDAHELLDVHYDCASSSYTSDAASSGSGHYTTSGNSANAAANAANAAAGSGSGSSSSIFERFGSFDARAMAWEEAERAKLNSKYVTGIIIRESLV
jgi:hypothetical protein